MKPALFAILLSAALSLCACDSAQAPKKAAAPAQRAALVTLATAETRDVPVLVETVGMVRPSVSVTLVSRTAGELQKALVRDGDLVKEGQLLFEIEKKPYQIALLQAEARLESDRAKLVKARDDYGRAQKMSKGGFSSASETESSRVAFISAQAAVKEDEAAIEKARLDLSYCEIRTPISGKAQTVLVDAGNVIGSQVKLLTIDRIMPAEIEFSIPEKYLPRIRANLRSGALRAMFRSKEGEQLSGGIIYSGSVDSSTGTIPMKAGFANERRELLSGEYLRVFLQLDVLKNALAVPARAVLQGPDGPFVYVVGEDRKARIRLVSTDIETDGITVISKGLSAGENVVLEGHVRLRDGVDVRIAEAGKAPALEGK